MPCNIAALLADHRSQPDRVLYRQFVDGGWRQVTVAQVGRMAARWQAAFRREGYAEGDRVALCVRNGVDWVALDLAALGMGLVVVPLYVDDNPENIAWCAAQAQARLLIVEHSRLAAGLARLPPGAVDKARVLILHPEADDPAPAVGTFLGDTPAGDFDVAALPPATLATICFTSGTAGRPKGVMLSHANILANVDQCRQTRMARPTDLFLSILPLSHMFERTGGYYLPLAIGAQVAYARGIAQIGEDLLSQAPTIVFAVPRIFERMQARIEHSLATAPVKRRLFAECVARGYRVATGTASAIDRMLVPLLRLLVATPVLARLGGRMRLAVVGGAALEPDLAHTFIGLGLAMLQGYGMTEASPVLAVNRDDDNVPESVGPPLPGVEMRVIESGELLARGANVMLGYWRNPEATAQVKDAEGWLHTGDLGEIRDGRIYIRGRAKDILVMSNGEKLPPQEAEFSILHDPAFEQVMLIGEGRPYLVLLAVTRETDERALLRRANDRLRAFPRWIRVRRVIATPDPWSVDNGLMTPTLKLKRPLLMQAFAARIEDAYREAPPA